MCEICEERVENMWPELRNIGRYRTPDQQRGQSFEITNLAADHININRNNMAISQLSFIRVLHYLLENHGNENEPCEIRSNNDEGLAGPLCRIARQENNVRCINYIIGILCRHDLVGVDGNRPNKTWLVDDV